MSSETPSVQQYEREPFLKRKVTDITDWFKKKGQNIKTSFLAYIKSKDTHKLWKRRLIIVGIIVLFILSIRIKEYFRLFPYDENSYLITNEERTTLTNYSGANGEARLETFLNNIDSIKSDSIRLTYSISGYAIYEDLKFDGINITMEIDQTRNKTIPKSERIKTTKTFTGYSITTSSSGKRTTSLVGEDGKDYVLFVEELIKS